jgi:hypothetical protein
MPQRPIAVSNIAKWWLMVGSGTDRPMVEARC